MKEKQWWTGTLCEKRNGEWSCERAKEWEERKNTKKNCDKFWNVNLSPFFLHTFFPFFTIFSYSLSILWLFLCNTRIFFPLKTSRTKWFAFFDGQFCISKAKFMKISTEISEKVAKARRFTAIDDQIKTHFEKFRKKEPKIREKCMWIKQTREKKKKKIVRKIFHLHLCFPCFLCVFSSALVSYSLIFSIKSQFHFQQSENSHIKQIK